MPDRHIFVGHYSPVDGALDEFERLWPVHVEEVVNLIDGFVAAQRYRIADKQSDWAQPAPTDRLVIYELEGDDADAIHRSNTHVRETEQFTPFNHLVRPGYLGHMYFQVGGVARAEGWGGRAAASGLLFTRSNPTEGNDESYNRWYDIHIQEVIQTVDGYVGAERYKIHPSQRPGMPPSRWQYSVIYERDDTDLDDVYRSHALAKKNRDTIFTPQNGVLADDIVGHSYVAVGPRVARSAEMATAP